MSIAGSSSIRRLKDGAVVVGLHEFAPVGRRASGGRDGRRLERLAKMWQDASATATSVLYGLADAYLAAGGVADGEVF